MRFILLIQQLFLIVIAAQIHNQIAPRGFKFVGKKKGVVGGCEAEDVAIILKELEIAQEAAEFAAEHFTEYPYFRAFQAPEHPFFKGKKLERAAKELFTRTAKILDGFHKDNKFRIECRSMLCLVTGGDSAALVWERRKSSRFGPNVPVMAFCRDFFETPQDATAFTSTVGRLRQFREVLDKNPEDIDTGSTIVNMSSVGNMRSQIILHELTHTSYVAKPVIELLNRKAETELKTLDDHTYDPLVCYRTARGIFDQKTEKKPDLLEGAKRAAENAESWGLIATGTYMSKQLGIEQIPIPGVPNHEWAYTDKTGGKTKD
ncbi:hypothetical protein QIS74_08783 [Colletotrichum tabaci]|uniref:Lysine-specific metallo-endopeptidase domain-containing protein n=1 Tax=Colletotrichum tabaci TaxID=1209068 RepID=A0AAV9T8K9_9PEZI